MTNRIELRVFHSQEVIYSDDSCHPATHWWIPIVHPNDTPPGYFQEFFRTFWNMPEKQFTVIGKDRAERVYVVLENYKYKHSYSDQNSTLLKILFIVWVVFPLILLRWQYEQKFIRSKKVFVVNPHFRGGGLAPNKLLLSESYSNWEKLIKQDPLLFLEALEKETHQKTEEIFQTVFTTRTNINALLTKPFIHALNPPLFEIFVKSIRKSYPNSFKELNTIFAMLQEPFKIHCDSDLEKRYRFVAKHILNILSINVEPPRPWENKNWHQIQSPNLWKTLPHDLLKIIFSFLSSTDLKRVSLVCEAWSKAAFSPEFMPFEGKIKEKLNLFLTHCEKKHRLYLLQAMSKSQMRTLGKLNPQIVYECFDIDTWLDCWFKAENSPLNIPFSEFELFHTCLRWCEKGTNPDEKNRLIQGEYRRNLNTSPQRSYVLAQLVLVKGTDADVNNFLRELVKGFGMKGERLQFAETVFYFFTHYQARVYMRLVERLIHARITQSEWYVRALEITHENFSSTNIEDLIAISKAKLPDEYTKGFIQVLKDFYPREKNEVLAQRRPQTIVEKISACAIS